MFNFKNKSSNSRFTRYYKYRSNAVSQFAADLGDMSVSSERFPRSQKSDGSDFHEIKTDSNFIDGQILSKVAFKDTTSFKSFH